MIICQTLNTIPINALSRLQPKLHRKCNHIQPQVQYTVEIHSILKEKFPKAEIWIQSILPRLFVSPKICQKIRDVNKRLLEKFEQFFFNPHKDFITGNGRIKRNFFRRDGLHLSSLGTNKLANEIQKIP